MGLVKDTSGSLEHFKDIAAEAPAQAAVQAESGTDAALERLKTTVAKHEAKAQYKPRDYDAEARGKTRCAQHEAALMSPAIAGMQFNTMEEYLKLVKQAADAGVAYSFGE